MRTTIRLSDQLLREAKTVAAATGRTLAELVEDALRESLTRRKSVAERRKVSLPISSAGGGLMPGVDLDDSAALLDLMGEPDDPS